MTGPVSSTHWEAAHALLILHRRSREGESRAIFDKTLADLYFALDGRYDPLACIRRARQTWQELRDRAEDDGVWAPIESSLAGTEREFALLHFRPTTRDRRVLVSEGRLPLRQMERPVLLCQNGGPTSSTIVEISSGLPPPGFDPNPLPAFTEEGWAQHRLELLYQDVCALSGQLAPQMGDNWRSTAFIERRIFAQIDAAHSLAEHLGHLEQIWQRSPAPDPTQLSGLGLVLGSLAGRDGLAVSERCLEQVWDEDPEYLDALGDAYVALAQPRVEDITSRWLEDERPEFRRQAVRVRARRGTLTDDQAVTACRDSDIVAEQALVPLVLYGSPRARSVLDEASLRFEQASPGFQEAFLVAGALFNYPSCRAHIMHRCQLGQRSFGELAGILAEKTDAHQLLSAAATQPNVALVEALGWAGDPECLPLLVGLLAVDDEEIVFTAAAALERITGAGLVHDYPITADAAMEDDLGVEPPEEPLLGQAKMEQDLPPEPEPELIELPSRDQDEWRTYIKAHEEVLVRGVKTRRGARHSPLVTLYELDQVLCSVRERQRLAQEIVLRTGLLFFFDERALVEHQEARISWLREVLQGRSHATGEWALPFQRSVIGGGTTHSG